MINNENVSTQRVQLVRHTFSYFFPYYWMSLAALLLLYHYLNTSHGIQFQPPWLDSSSYVDYTSKHAAMAAAWVAIAGISVREQKASSIVSSCLSRKIPSFCIALILTFQSSTLLVANYEWLTKEGDDFFIKLTSGAVGVSFSLAAIISPYLFILLAQGNPDPETLKKRQTYLSREQIYLQKLVNDATEIEKDATGYTKQEHESLALKLFRRSTYFTSIAVICCIVGYIVAIASHIRSLKAVLPFTYVAVLIGLTSIAFFIVFLLTTWTWKQLWVQKTVDFNGEKLYRIILGLIASCFASIKTAVCNFRRSSQNEERVPPKDRDQETSQAARDSINSGNEEQPSKKGVLHYISAIFTSLTLLALFSFAGYILFIIGRSVFWYIIPEIPYIKNAINENIFIKIGISFICGIVSLLSTIAATDIYARTRRQPTPFRFKQWTRVSLSQVASKVIATNDRDTAVLHKLTSQIPPGERDRVNRSCHCCGAPRSGTKPQVEATSTNVQLSSRGASDTMPSGEQRSGDQHGQSPTNEQRQPDEIPPVDGLAQDEGGEEDSDQDAQLVDGDDHASRAVLKCPVVADPGGTGGGPGGEDEAELPTRNTTDLPESSGDGHHHQHHLSADRGTKVGLHPSDAGPTEDRGGHSEDE